MPPVLRRKMPDPSVRMKVQLSVSPPVLILLSFSMKPESDKADPAFLPAQKRITVRPLFHRNHLYSPLLHLFRQSFYPVSDP